MIHLKDTTKPRGIRCNRWNQGFLRTSETTETVSCKTCKGERRADRSPAVKTDGLLAPGHIFYESWGYNMTIVDFYVVKRVTPKGAEVVGLGQNETATGFLCGTTVPILKETGRHGILIAKSFREGEVYLKGTMKNLYGNGSNDKRSVFLTRWSGKPVHFNHCD